MAPTAINVQTDTISTLKNPVQVNGAEQHVIDPEVLTRPNLALWVSKNHKWVLSAASHVWRLKDKDLAKGGTVPHLSPRLLYHPCSQSVPFRTPTRLICPESHRNLWI